MPRIGDALDTLCGATYLLLLDLRPGYWHIPMGRKDKEKTVFVTPDCLLEFNAIALSLSNKPTTYDSVADAVLRGLRAQE